MRCGTLDLICRNNQARIPGFFKEERELAIYTDALQTMHQKFAGTEDDKAIIDLLKSGSDKIQQAILDTVYALLEHERKLIFHRKRISRKTLIT